MSFRMIERTLFGLEIFKLRQPLQILAQMPRGKRSLEAGPAGGLRLIAASEGLQDIDPGILPFEIRPAASPMLGRLDGLPGLVGRPAASSRRAISAAIFGAFLTGSSYCAMKASTSP